MEPQLGTCTAVEPDQDSALTLTFTNSHVPTPATQAVSVTNEHSTKRLPTWRTTWICHTMSRSICSAQHPFNALPPANGTCDFWDGFQDGPPPLESAVRPSHWQKQGLDGLVPADSCSTVSIAQCIVSFAYQEHLVLLVSWSCTGCPCHFLLPAATHAHLLPKVSVTGLRSCSCRTVTPAMSSRHLDAAYAWSGLRHNSQCHAYDSHRFAAEPIAEEAEKCFIVC